MEERNFAGIPLHTTVVGGRYAKKSRIDFFSIAPGTTRRVTRSMLLIIKGMKGQFALNTWFKAEMSVTTHLRTVRFKCRDRGSFLVV